MVSLTVTRLLKMVDLLKRCEILCVPHPEYSFSPKPIDKSDQMEEELK